MELDRPAPGPNVRDAGAGPPTRHEQSRERRFKAKHPKSKDAKDIKAFQRRDPASFSSFFTTVRCSFSCTAARDGALLRSRETRRRYERETPPPARRDDVRVPFGNKHILLGGGAAARRAFHPRYRRRYLARQEEKNEKLGVGIKADERTEAQQQACVAASATVDA